MRLQQVKDKVYIIYYFWKKYLKPLNIWFIDNSGMVILEVFFHKWFFFLFIKEVFFFQVAKCAQGSKPCLVFAGEPFDQDHEYQRIKNLLIGKKSDFYEHKWEAFHQLFDILKYNNKYSSNPVEDQIKPVVETTDLISVYGKSPKNLDSESTISKACKCHKN